MVDFIYGGQHAPELKYNHDEWTKRNGSFGYVIAEASESDSLVKYFVDKVMANAPYITPSDKRLAVAYGYFVHLELMTVEKAEEICGIAIAPMTKEQVLAVMGL